MKDTRCFIDISQNSEIKLSQVCNIRKEVGDDEKTEEKECPPELSLWTVVVTNGLTENKEGENSNCSSQKKYLECFYNDEILCKIRLAAFAEEAIQGL